MGSSDNITEQKLTELAQSANIPLVTLKQQIMAYLSTSPQVLNSTFEQMFSLAATAWGQSVEEAKKNTIELLSSQLNK